METELLEPCRIDFSDDGEDEGRECLPVYLRIKPHDDEEMSIKVLDGTTVETNHAFRANKRATYTRVFPGSATQQQVFDGSSAQLIRKFLDGANVMTFAYGVTSSGKTYTIMGSPNNPGVLPRSLEIIFGSFRSKIEKSSPIYMPSKFDEAQETTAEEIDQLERYKSTLISKLRGSNRAFDQYSFANTTPDACLTSIPRKESPLLAAMSCCVWISIYEIHNEVITDLLHADPKTKRRALNIGQDSKARTFVRDLLQLPVRSASEAYALLQFARQNLATATTKLNDSSSRSHMVFNLKMVHWGGPMAEPFVNQFIISDLAGSERQSKTGTSGPTLRQAGAINNSLLVLGRCLEALRKKDKGIAAPFRDSKLTRMLNPFFTQGGYVSLIICINPDVHLQDETMDTIRFSAIASEIVQDPIRPLERLRQLRRLTLGCIENSPMKIVYDTDVEHWQDAVNGTAVHDGVAYLEVKASYFNDMARDILRAEKLLTANEEEIESLKERLRESEVSKENIKLMYQDKMKEQREKFSAQRAELEEMHRDMQKTLVEELEEDIQTYKDKYSKYRDGYAKLSDYLKDKLWPEVYLFRERFGYLPEFPPKDGEQDEETKAENTIKYWQDKLQDKEAEFRSLRTKLGTRNEELASLRKQLEDQKRQVQSAEADYQESRREAAVLSSRVTELNEQLAALKNQLSDHDTLFDEVSDLKQRLQLAEERRESLVAHHQVRIDAMIEELDSLKSELREKDSELGETSGALASAQAQVDVLKKAVANIEKQQSRCETDAKFAPEKAKLEQKILALEAELGKERKQALELRESILSLREEIERYAEKEADLKKREAQIAFGKRNARLKRTSENDIARLEDDMKRLQLALDEGKEALAEKNIQVLSKDAELDELRDKVATIEILGRQMEKLSEENKEIRDKLKVFQFENKRLETEVKQTRELEVEVEFLTRKLENQQRRILRDQPQTEKPNRRRRSVSSSEVELKVPATEKPRRRLRLGNEENSVLDRTLDRAIRDISPAPTPYRTRSSRKR
ncbi:kinesin-like protein KIF20A [Galendromus occidentalis]|uniref:Kinesin-like protein KIF20A n=1 Tax=Galendromus occidentalis TaxID=34638 RepID=A0AAJ7L542_9ACAR|nr:kinesin-like protein KIF20A [Galendromus occidentalis]